jgi:hypothetical protein
MTSAIASTSRAPATPSPAWRWLWTGRVARRLVTNVSGDADTTALLALRVVADLAGGHPLPGDTQERQPGPVLLVTPVAEHRELLKTMGADLGRIDIVPMEAPCVDGMSLARLAADIGYGLVVVIRAEGLDLEHLRCAVRESAGAIVTVTRRPARADIRLQVTSYSRAQGSQVVTTIETPTTAERSLLFAVEDTASRGSINRSPAAAASDPRTELRKDPPTCPPRPSSPTGQARSFLDTYLGSGSRPVAAVNTAGARYGHDAATLRAAAQELGVLTIPGRLTTAPDGRLVAEAKWSLPLRRTSRRSTRPTTPRDPAIGRGRHLPCGCIACPKHADDIVI